MSSSKTRIKLAIIAPTCFYYQAALFRELAAHPRIDLTVYFCSEEGIKAWDVLEMYKVDKQWGVAEELLEGYRFKFLKNYSPYPSYLKWPFGLINVGIMKEIILGRPDLVILMSWMNPTWWMALAACVFRGIPFFYMTDANVQIEPLRSKWKRRIKALFLGRLLFRLSAGFLCAGTANKQLYQLYGVPDYKLFPFAYSWGYDSLFKISADLKSRRSQIRADLGLPEDSLVVLYCGRLSREKNLFHLVEAYHRLEHPRKSLVLVGDGELKQALQDRVEELKVDSVHFFGFQDRNQVSKFYATSDLLVLPSARETWGIVVNEAMCFGLPVVVSHQVGAGIDLVVDGHNGYSVATWDVDALFQSIKQLADLSEEDRLLMGTRAADMMREWSQRSLADSLVQSVDAVMRGGLDKPGGGPTRSE